MEPATPSEDQKGPDLKAQNVWRAGAAAVAALIILGVSAAAGVAAVRLFEAWIGVKAENEAFRAARLAVYLVAMQIVTVALTIFAAQRLGTGGTPLLPFTWPRHALKQIVAGTVSIFVFMALLGAAMRLIDQDALASDVTTFATMAKTPVWWALMIGAAIGAPIAEELLFRGLLFGALRDTRIGFLATALVTSLMWSVLHMQYSLYGVTAIFCIGLYLAWLRETTGSLVPPIIVHGLYNGTIVAGLAFLTENAVVRN